MAGIISLLCFTIMAGEFIGIIATDYCNMKSCKASGTVHTMCKFTSPKPAAACKQWSNQGFNDAERKAIVQIHNQLRQKVASGKETRGKNGPQPPAVSMPDLTWDNELETIAQRWVNQCIEDHDDCCDVERFWVGQNLAATCSSGENKSSLEQLIQMWYDEVAKFNKNQISSYADDEDGDMVGHYTQMVWAATTKIGCGRIKYKEARGCTSHFLVCNYGPSGNVEGQKIYQIKK